MADQFSNSVDLGLKLSKRIYYGKDQPVQPPEAAVMDRNPSTKSDFSTGSVTGTYLPTGPMMYAEVSEPSMVDNPDIPSYQPYVYGRCEPPALIPLHMHGISMEVDCYMDSAFVTVTGEWRLHCISAGRSCDCRIAIPMGPKGSILGVQAECPTKSLSTQLVKLEEGQQDVDNKAKAKDGFLLKGYIYTMKIPRVDGGSMISVRVSWYQKLLYQDNQFCLKIPFSFQPYVTPVGKKIPKMERIHLKVNSGVSLQILCKSASHPLKVVNRQAGKLEFSYDREVPMWSTNDFGFLYSVSASDIFGSVLLQSPPIHDFDQRDMFCLYLYPGNGENRKCFKKEVVFLVDVSASMKGCPIEHTKTAVQAALSKLNPYDSFNIIAFNDDILSFASSLMPATKEAIENAIQWIGSNVMADGGTNISPPLSQALKMMSKIRDSISLIFLITDGSVEDERGICAVMRQQLAKGGMFSPRIFTFGIGSYCNHYFLQILAQIGRGYYDGADDIDSISFQMERFFDQASSIILADLRLSGLEHLDSLELYPFNLPDLSSGTPLIISGRYSGNFPDLIKVNGMLVDSSNLVIEAKVHKTKEVPLERILAKSQIDAVTANAWLSESKQVEEKVVKLSLQTGFPSEYTDMILFESSKEKYGKPHLAADKENAAALNGNKKVTLLRNVGLGFGSLKATAENLPPETAEPKLHETSEMILKAATNLCGKLMDHCCCMCFIQFCSKLNDQCAIVFTQLGSALACFGCMNFCCEVCFSCDFCSG